MSNPGPFTAWTTCDWCGEEGGMAVYCGCGDGPFHPECLDKHTAVDHGGRDSDDPGDEGMKPTKMGRYLFTCEGCGKYDPDDMHRTADDVPLCTECAKELVAAADPVEAGEEKPFRRCGK